MINESLYPSLISSGGYEITSEATDDYNCFAFAAGVQNSWWDTAPDYEWPGGAPRDYNIDSLLHVYRSCGFEDCDSPDLEPGFEKIAIYADSGEIEHACRQLANGKWTSKMGPDEDISHLAPDALAGDHYGQVVRYMRRPL